MPVERSDNLVAKPAFAASFDSVIDQVVRVCTRHWIIAVVVAGLALYLPFLGQRAFYVEEGARALQAVAIREGGSWWLLDLAGQRYLNKPPLLPWLIALTSFVTGGINEWAVRLPSVIFMIVSALCAGGIARLLLAERDVAQQNLAAFAAGIAFVCCPSIIERTRIGETDVTTTGCVAIAFLVFATGWSRQRLTLASWAAIAAALAAAAFAKGPIPLGFAVLPIIAAVAMERPRAQLLPAIAAIGLSLLPLLVWAYLNLQDSEIGHWVGQMRVRQITLMSRLEYLLPLLYLNQVPRWLLGMMPWAIFAGGYLWCRRNELRRNGLLRAVAIYAIAMTLLVLLPPGVRGRYALPAVVPVMALAGAAVAAFWDNRRVRHAFAGSAIALAVAAALNAMVFSGRSPSQDQMRVDIADLTRVLNERSAGRLLVIRPDFNLMTYGRRPITTATPATIACPRPDDTLIAPQHIDVAGASKGAWTGIGPIGTSGFVAYAAQPGPCSLGGPPLP
jgi:4-amino-4-deoxy-L-arabinose transferase-like glycosyltransferase